MHSETKQAEMSEFGAEKNLLQGLSKENSRLALKKPKLPHGFWGGVFIGKIGVGKGCKGV